MTVQVGLCQTWSETTKTGFARVAAHIIRTVTSKEYCVITIALFIKSVGHDRIAQIKTSEINHKLTSLALRNHAHTIN